MRQLILLLLALPFAAACHRPAAVAPVPAVATRDVARDTTLPTTATAPAESHDWVGSYELVGHGFPEGDRVAVLDIDRLPSGELAMRFAVGPPGTARRIEAVGATLYVDWLLLDLSGREQPMNVRLEAEGDRISGEWSIGNTRFSGAIDGRRLR